MIYSCQSFKPFSEAETNHRQNLNDVIDQLLRVFPKEGFAVSGFECGSVALPEEMESGHQERARRRTLSTHLPDGQSYLRDLAEKSHAAR